MTRVISTVVATALLAFGTAADAQPTGRDRGDRQAVARAQGVPPGHLPPASECRVWYDGRPPGRQPAPTSCGRAEAAAARDRNARVVYGEDAYWDWTGRQDDRDGRYSDRDRDNDRAVPRGSVRDPRQDDRRIDRNDRRGSEQEGSIAYRNGYRDGVTKGRADVEEGRRSDPTRHSWHRSATRGYESRHGTRYEYINRYRAGFEAGYAAGYRSYRRR